MKANPMTVKVDRPCVLTKDGIVIPFAFEHGQDMQDALLQAKKKELENSSEEGGWER